MHQSNEATRKLKEAIEVLTNYQNLWQDTCNDMKQVDLEITDILHELEFTDFNKSKGHELALEIKRLRNERRVIKEDQSVFMILRQFCEKNATFSSRLQETVDRMDNEIGNRSARAYRPRIRTEQMSVIYAEENHQEIAVIAEDMPEITEVVNEVMTYN